LGQTFHLGVGHTLFCSKTQDSTHFLSLGFNHEGIGPSQWKVR